MENWQRQVLVDHADAIEEDLANLQREDGREDQGPGELPQVPRPFAQYYDFIEVCGGSGVISEQVAALGWVVGPIIGFSFSFEYDFTKLRVVEWLLFLVRERRVKAVALEPPCATFSPAAWPSQRSYRVPRGYNQRLSKVWFGNRLAFACLLILWEAAMSTVLALLETPRRSKMAWLSEWQVAVPSKLGERP